MVPHPANNSSQAQDRPSQSPTQENSHPDTHPADADAWVSSRADDSEILRLLESALQATNGSESSLSASSSNGQDVVTASTNESLALSLQNTLELWNELKEMPQALGNVVLEATRARRDSNSSRRRRRRHTWGDSSDGATTEAQRGDLSRSASGFLWNPSSQTNPREEDAEVAASSEQSGTAPSCEDETEAGRDELKLRRMERILAELEEAQEDFTAALQQMVSEEITDEASRA